MPPLVSAGLLIYRRSTGRVEVLLVHPGGPFFRGKDEGWWSIPKGLVEPSESPLDAAVRELNEEVGIAAIGPFLPLGSVRQKGGKVVHAWACEGDRPDEMPLPACGFRREWPPHSGQWVWIPEADAAAFFPLAEARRKMNAAQTAFLDRLMDALGGS